MTSFCTDQGLVSKIITNIYKQIVPEYNTHLIQEGAANMDSDAIAKADARAISIGEYFTTPENTGDILAEIQKEYNKPDCKWAFSGFANWDGKDHYDKKVPIWADKTLEGRNLLSSPTVVSFLNECKDLPIKKRSGPGKNEVEGYKMMSHDLLPEPRPK